MKNRNRIISESEKALKVQTYSMPRNKKKRGAEDSEVEAKPEVDSPAKTPKKLKKSKLDLIAAHAESILSKEETPAPSADSTPSSKRKREENAEESESRSERKSKADKKDKSNATPKQSEKKVKQDGRPFPNAPKSPSARAQARSRARARARAKKSAEKSVQNQADSELIERDFPSGSNEEIPAKASSDKKDDTKVSRSDKKIDKKDDTKVSRSDKKKAAKASSDKKDKKKASELKIAAKASGNKKDKKKASEPKTEAKTEATASGNKKDNTKASKPKTEAKTEAKASGNKKDNTKASKPKTEAKTEAKGSGNKKDNTKASKPKTEATKVASKPVDTAAAGESLEQWLKLLKIAEKSIPDYLIAFDEAGLDAVEHMFEVEEDDLMEMGVKKFHAKIMARWLAAEKESRS
jgi:hypothetical protein